MKSEGPIDNWWDYLRAVLFRPTWEFLATGGFFTFLFVMTWWRDNFASDVWKRRLELKGLLPHWHPAVWLTVGIFCLLFLVLRRTYDLWRIQRDELTLFRAKAAPEFVIDFAKEGDEVVGFKLRNTSPQNLYNLAVANMKSRVGEIWWWENFFTCIEARVGEIILKPHSMIGSSIRFQDVPALRRALVETPGGTNPESVGALEIYADDGEGNRYRFSTDLQLWNGWTWRVWETDRMLVKPKVTAQVQ
ncbi:MAG TPA: hypothetical protein VGS10_12240 [Terracidiphilus sp.]|nr:hypothetical protein [Terracidiphilus sp.]